MTRRNMLVNELSCIDILLDGASTRIRSKSQYPHKEFATVMANILKERGPLDLDELCDAYWTKYPEKQNRSRDALRVALTRREQVINRVSETDRRYWLVGVPLNGAHAPVT